MKTICFLYIFLLFLLGSPLTLSAQSDQPLVMAFNNTISKPWKWIENGTYVGPFIDAMQQVADRSRIRIELKPLPWKRVLLGMKSGEVDGFFGGYKTAERESFGLFVETPLSWSTLSIFVRKGKAFSFDRIDDLYGRKIGIVRGYNTSAEFDQAANEKKILVEETSNYISLIKMLAAGRIEGIVGATSTIQAHLVDMNWTDRFSMLPNPVAGPKPIYICLSKRSKNFDQQELAAKMNQALKAMETENVFEEIAKKYGYSKCVVFGCISQMQ